MKQGWKIIHCPNRVEKSNYHLYEYVIDPIETDAEFFEKIYADATELAKRLDSRDTDGQPRPWAVKLKDSYLGVLAENLIVESLQSHFGEEATVKKDTFVSHDQHVDIIIDWNNGNTTTIEVRSSFAHDNMAKVIQRTFDHLGPYTTAMKPKEVLKDFYLRGILFEGEKKGSFSYDRIHPFYFAGGVPSHWFQEKGKIKHGRRMREIDRNTAEKLLETGNETIYWTIPIPNGLDVPEIIAELRGVGSGV